MTSKLGPSFALKLLAVLEVGGALYGLYSTLRAVSETEALSSLTAIAFGTATVLYVLSLVAGVLLSRGLQLGVLLSTILQWLQVVRLSTPGLGYMFYSGGCLFVGLSEGAPGFTFALGSAWTFHLTKEGAPISYALNAFPILALVFLQRTRFKVPSGAKQAPTG